jgi:hypothetical protein
MVRRHHQQTNASGAPANRDELAGHVSTDPAEALAGHEVVLGNPGH